MSIKDHPQKKNIPVQRPEAQATGTVIATTSPLTAPFAAVVRIAMGLLFVWAFLDKAFGFGYATPADRAWVNGGSPTKGFLGGVDHGPFAGMFQGWAGDAWADWLFMLGLAGVGFALLLGVGLRVAAASGSVMHAVNLGWHPRAEQLLWRPDLQEAKRSGNGAWNLRYRARHKRQELDRLLRLITDEAPYLRVRYAF